MQELLQPKTTLPLSAPSARPSLLNKKTGWAMLLGAALIWALLQAGLFREDLVNPGGWGLIRRFAAASLRPTLTPEFLWLTLDATLATLAFAVAGTFLSLIFGVGGGLLASELWWEGLFGQRAGQTGRRWFRLPWLAWRGLLAGLRAIHEIIWGLFFVNVIGLDPLTAILAIAIPFGAVTAKIFSEILDETARAPLYALQNSGVAPAQAFLYTLLPQAFRDMLSYGFYRFECSIRAAAVLGIIGAGGLGYQIFLSMQTLNYEQVWTLFLALFLLNGLADFWSALLRRRLGLGSGSCQGGACLELETRETSPRPARRQQPVRRGDPVIRGSIWLAVGLVIFSFWYVQPDVGKLFSAQSREHLAYVGRLAFPPDFTLFSWQKWLELTMITVAMSLLATAGAGALGLLLAFPAANSFALFGGGRQAGSSMGWLTTGGRWLILLLSRAVLLVSRSIPPPIWALLFLFVLFPGILPGAAGLGLYTLGVLGRLMAEVVENLDERPLNALRAQGAGPGQVFAYGVLPSTAPRFIGYLLYRWEETIRATVVVGLVGAGGLGRQLTQQLSSFNYPGVLSTLLVFVALIFVVDMISAAARRTFRSA